jgi:DNA-binding IclR family transcriptional regulator
VKEAVFHPRRKQDTPKAQVRRGVLEGAFTLLDELIRHQGEAGLTQLAKACSIPKATAHRLLDQLTELEVVQRTENRYRIGARAFQLGQAWQPYPRLLDLVRRPLRVLATTTQASAVLAVPCENHILIAAASLTRPEHVFLLRPGSVMPQDVAACQISPQWLMEHGLAVRAAPVRLPTGDTIGSIAAVVPPQRKPTTVSEAVGQTARAISTALGR